MLFDVNDIQKVLPHRYPFLLIDRVLDLTPGKEIVALKNVTINEAFFQGHFPGKPIMPGVLMIEAMAQAGGVLAYKSTELDDNVVYFMSIDKVKFRKPVVPGDQLRLEVRVTQHRGKVWRFDGETKVDGNLVCEAQFMAMTAKE
jgi:3-hydroxyacyl-[acyl-carrier-protein] dehydratase